MEINFIQIFGTYTPIITAIVTLASAICAATPTPKEGTWQSKIYKIIDFLAINVGKAKDK